MLRKHPISQRWLDLFKLIPGYDPVATAGDCTFDEKTAEKVISFFSKYLTHIEGAMAGKPFVLKLWQQAIIGCIFGWKRPDGTRRYREAMVYVPRKNGKTTLIGGLINVVAFCDDEPGAQLYSAAAEIEQAKLVYRQAKGMILNNAELSRDVKIYATYKSMEFPGGSVYKALSSDADTKHGFNTHLAIIDELHAQPNRDLVDVLITSTGSRRQPLIIYITTADFDRESICNEKHEYACKVRDGIIIDPSFLPVVYESHEGDDWADEHVWEKCNPNIDVSVSRDYLRRECQRAKDTPTYENTFKRLHLNMKTQQDVRWIAIESWDKCNDKVDENELAGRICYGGLDLSTKLDISAYVLLFPPTADDKFWRVLPRFWVPGESAAKREKQDRVPYQTWARQGYVKTVEDWTVDYRLIKNQIIEDVSRFELKQVGFDPWNSKQIAKELQDEGANVVEFGQGFRSMSEPTKELERLVVEKVLAHGGNPVLRWMASNVAVEIDPAGNLKPSKKKSTERIDGIVALIMALGLAMVDAQTTSVYESRGLITI